MVTTSHPSPGAGGAFARRIDRGVASIARHWLAVVNIVAGFAVGLPLLAAWLLFQGQALPARLIFLFFSPICHQRPDRSFFPWGEQMAYCQRSAAIGATVLGLGLLYGLVRRRLRPLRWSVFLALIAPMALDGVTQLLGWRESTWELRVITGALFALAAVWLLYPTLELGMAEIRASLTPRLGDAADRQPHPSP